jgi:hypothetical protein
LSHGQFGRWLSAEFGWSERTAQRFLQAAEVFGSKADTVSVLEPTAIYALSAKSTPPTVRDAVVARLEAGERPALAEIKAEVAAARKEAQQAKAGRVIARKFDALLRRRSSGPARKARSAAEFILEHLGEHRAALVPLLDGVDAQVLLTALRGDAAKGGVVHSIEL